VQSVCVTYCLSCIVRLRNKRHATTRQLELDLLARHWPRKEGLPSSRRRDEPTVRVRYKHRQDGLLSTYLYNTNTPQPTLSMKITINSFRAVATWKWDLPEESDDTCGICRVNFEGTCSKCKFPGDDCPIIVGECRHCFHMVCRLVIVADETSVEADTSLALHQRLDLLGC
jgi:anaphase-promoting complex subunit 11